MVNDGFSAGLRIWLFFLCCFFALGYSVSLSICLGALGGLAGGFMVAWWKSRGDVSEPVEESGDKEKIGPFQRTRERLRRLREQAQATRDHRPNATMSRWPSRKKRRSFRSRR